MSAVDIAVAGVDLVEPAFVFPAGGSEVDALLGEGLELGLEELAGGGHGVVGVWLLIWAALASGEVGCLGVFKYQ